ncbi:MAG: 8-amino-7-oxononanoate synthase [bacterium]
MSLPAGAQSAQPRCREKRYPLVEQELEALARAGRHRSLRSVQSAQAERIVLDGRTVLLFCSNNYLGLADHPALKAAATEAIEKHGCGSGASRLISGNMRLHEQLEERLARFKGYPACLLFNSGYAANVGILSSLMAESDAIYSDALNHASIIDGCRLSRARVHIYRHADPGHLESLLADAARYRKRLIVTDSLFSMDGDLAPLADLAFLAGRHDCLLMVDEAHATGVLGRNGRGGAEHFGVEEAVDVSMGTLGKALGSFGAFAASSATLRDYFINRARSLIYSTSLPPAVLAAAMKALDIVETEPARRLRLRENAAIFAEGLRALGCSGSAPATPIQRLLFGDERLTMEGCERLLARGVYAQGIRPPTVPPGTSRIRFSLMATHTPDDIRHALQAVGSILAARDPEGT